MAAFVVDASATLPWCFGDEATDWTRGLLSRVRSGDQMLVPAHWTTEVTNALLSAIRKQRIPGQDAIDFLNDLGDMPVEIDPAPSPARATDILSICEKYQITAYDATYLELAVRRKSPLATLDADLRKAALAEGVMLL